MVLDVEGDWNLDLGGLLVEGVEMWVDAGGFAEFGFWSGR